MKTTKIDVFSGNWRQTLIAGDENRYYNYIATKSINLKNGMVSKTEIVADTNELKNADKEMVVSGKLADSLSISVASGIVIVVCNLEFFPNFNFVIQVFQE